MASLPLQLDALVAQSLASPFAYLFDESIMSNINDLRANHDNEHDHEAVVQRQMMANPRAYHLNYLSKWVRGGRS